MGWVVNRTPGCFTHGKEIPVPIVQKAGLAPGPVWTGVENLASNRIRSSGRPTPIASHYTDYAIPAHRKLNE